MKNIKKLFVFLVAAPVLLFAVHVNAATLSQSSINVSVGQTATVYATNVSTSLYVSSNSNSNVATVSVYLNTITVYGNTYGNTTATICENSIGSCSSLYITVTGSGNSTSLSLSQTSLSLSSGQSATVTAYNAYNAYGTSIYVSNNSNQSVATASISGNTITVYGSSYGSTTMTLCQSYNTSCATLYVTVGYNNSTYNNNTNSLNISNMTLAVGNSITISPNYNNGSYSTNLYISSNPNPNVISTSSSSSVAGCTAGALYSVITGQPCNATTTYGTNNNNSIVLTALSQGTDTITLCQNSGFCNTINITVSGYSSNDTNYYYTPGNNTNTYTNNSGIPVVYSTSSAD